MPQSQFVSDLELSINDTSAKSPTGASLAALFGRRAGGREPQLRHSKTLHDYHGVVRTPDRVLRSGDASSEVVCSAAGIQDAA